MITSIEKINNEKIKFNGCLTVSNFELNDNILSYDLEFDTSLLTEQEANEISEKCILELLENKIKDE